MVDVSLKGEVMNRALGTSGAVMLMGIILLSSQGCNQKLLRPESEGERVSERVGTKPPSLSGENSRGDTNLPPISGEHSRGDMKPPPVSGESSSGELSGFSRNPSEERIAEGGYLRALTPPDIASRQHAELTKEEKAAVKAGLQDVFFAFDEWTLSEAGMAALDHNAAYLQNHPAALLKIEGHCDERGTAAYNMVLGDNRAKAARSYLVEILVKLEQLAIVSYGKERPFCLDRDESCYQQNRRDHMLLTINKEGTPE
jgi:peptidoglycan-associated lipoprotein